MPDDIIFNPSALRRRAERLLDRDADKLDALALEEIRTIVHDLRVHQIELELQNEELRRLYHQVEESKERYSRLFNNAPVGYLTLNHSGLILRSNLTFLKMVGADSEAEALYPDNRPLTDFIAPEDRDEFRARYRAFFKKPQGKAMEISMARPDGSGFIARLEGRIEETAATITNDEAEPVMLLVVTDITRQRESEQDSERQAQLLESLLSAIPNPVYYKNLEGKCLGCNQAFEELVGQSRKRIVGEKEADLWPKVYQADYARQDLALLKRPAAQRQEYEIPDPSGRPRSFIVFKSPFYNENRQVAGLVGVFLEITDRKEAEETLREESALNAAMAGMAQTLLSGACIEETSFPILKISQDLTGSPYGFVGYIERETGVLICPTLTREIWPDCKIPDKSAVFEEFKGLWGWVLKNGSPLMTNQAGLDPHSTGVPAGHIPINRFLSAPVMIGPKVVGIIAVCNADRDYGQADLSLVVRLAALFGLAIQRMRAEEDLRWAKEEAEAANAAKNNFLATMSHEIRTPMNAILGFTDMTLDSGLSAQQKENLDIVSSAARHLMNLLNDILDLSKIETGHIKVDCEEFDLTDALDEAAAALSLRAIKKGISFSHHLAPDLPRRVIGDRHRLYQVLFNLITNAIKFTQKGGVVLTARAEEAPGPNQIKARFMVEDSGIGVPPDKLTAIFEPFTQVDSSTTRQYGGTGLGLAISRRLVEAMGGEIWVDSRLGLGSRFHFTVLFSAVAPPKEVASSRPEDLTPRGPAPQNDPETLRILLVEDNLINQKLAVAYLTNKNYRVLVADNGHQAVEKFQREKVDLIIMDVEMPGMNGLDTTKAIRELEALTARHTPIIAMTAHAMKGDRERFLEAGMDDYLSKPVDVELLHQVILRHSPGTEG